MDAPVSLSGDQCVVHGSHWPPVRETEQHHIWPLGMGGPDVKTNKVKICPTGHANVHVALRRLVAGGSVRVGVDGTRAELALAQRAFAEWDAAGRP